MRTAAEIAALIPFGEFCKNPRMRQLHRVMTTQKLADSELPIFEKEVLAYLKKYNDREEKRRSWLKAEAKRYLG